MKNEKWFIIFNDCSAWKTFTALEHKHANIHSSKRFDQWGRKCFEANIIVFYSLFWLKKKEKKRHKRIPLSDSIRIRDKTLESECVSAEKPEKSTMKTECFLFREGETDLNEWKVGQRVCTCVRCIEWLGIENLTTVISMSVYHWWNQHDLLARTFAHQTVYKSGVNPKRSIHCSHHCMPTSGRTSTVWNRRSLSNNFFLSPHARTQPITVSFIPFLFYFEINT